MAPWFPIGAPIIPMFPLPTRICAICCCICKDIKMYKYRGNTIIYMFKQFFIYFFHFRWLIQFYKLTWLYCICCICCWFPYPAWLTGGMPIILYIPCCWKNTTIFSLNIKCSLLVLNCSYSKVPIIIS